MLHGLKGLIPGLLLMASACAHAGSPEIRESGIRAYVDVTNEYTLPMEVYISGSGINQRLGTVDPGMGSHFTVPQNLIGNGSLRLEARPTGGGQPFRSGDILIAPGAVVDLKIGSQLFNSTVTHRP